MTVSSKTPLLDQIKTPDDLRRLDPRDLRQVADELRRQADNFIELDELKAMIQREGGPRASQAPAYAQSA